MSIDHGVDCSACREAPRVFVTVVKGGEAVTVGFCPKHAEAAGVLHPAGWHLLPTAEASLPGSMPVAGPQCPGCGFALARFEREGRLGCGDCYQAFSASLDPLLRRMHPGSRHRGKIPARERDEALLKMRIRILEKELAEAIGREAFEDAAMKRDQIRAIRDELEPSSH
jgi:protein arginine kinase activator